MELIIGLVVAVSLFCGGGYCGYRYGRSAEAKYNAAREAAKAVVEAVKQA